ncbi:MAG: class I SAM-dependent methyltransferase [Gammaproteobacteria bacterium]|nr:class I SAM-dependent methyltransferase [Gammaproteobacteria bacterium]
MKENQASSTAFTVLQGILYTARHPRHSYLAPGETVEAGRRILAASEEGKKRLRRLESRWFRLLVPVMERLLMPGITLHYVLRKRFIEDAALQAISGGATQVVNLGAGFDTLAWCLHARYPNVNFIEIDHPATNAVKAKALFQPDRPPPNLHLLAVDFSKQNLEEALAPFAGFHPERPTLFICEGVLMYLDKKDVTQLLDSLKRLTGEKTRLVFTCVEPMNSSRNNTGPLLKFYLIFKKEPLNWTIERENLPAFLTDQGYKSLEIASTEVFKSRYLSAGHQGELHQGEYIAVAEIV